MFLSQFLFYFNFNIYFVCILGELFCLFMSLIIITDGAGDDKEFGACVVNGFEFIS